MSEQIAKPVGGQMPTLRGFFAGVAAVIRKARRRQRKRRIALAAVLVAIAGATTYWEAARPHGSGLAGSRETITITHFRLGAAPVAVTTAAGSLWVVEETANGMRVELTRIDPQSGRRLSSYPIGRTGPDFGAVEAVGHVLWATAGNHVIRVDADNPSAPAERAAIPGEGDTVTLGFGSVWVAAIGQAHNVIERFNADSLAPQAHIPLDVQPVALRAGLGSLWLATTSGLWRINTTTNQLQPTGVAGYLVGLAVSSNRLWLIQQSIELTALDDHARVLTQLELPFYPGAITGSPQGLWVTNNCGCKRGTVSLIGKQNQTVFTRPIGETPVAITANGSTAWVATFADGTVSRVTSTP